MFTRTHKVTTPRAVTPAQRSALLVSPTLAAQFKTSAKQSKQLNKPAVNDASSGYVKPYARWFRTP